MTIDVLAPSYDSAAAALIAVNHDAATLYVDLVTQLEASGSMAGDDSTSTDFAAAYDIGSQAAVDAIGHLVDAVGNLGVLTASSIENHRRGDAAAVFGTPPLLYDGCWIAPGTGELDVAPFTVPSSVGGDGGGLPRLLDVIIDHVQGVVWPNADCDRLRHTGLAWRTAASALDLLDDGCRQAVGLLNEQNAPEIDLALRAIADLRGAAADLADTCRSLATSCDDYAEHVEHHRDQIEDLLRQLAIEAGATAVIGGVLSVATGGLTGMAATAAIGARAATFGARIVKVLDKLRAAVRAGPLVRLRSASAKVEEVAPVLRRLRNRTQRGSAGLGKRSPDELVKNGEGWRSTTFADRSSSFRYHYNKHGRDAGVSPEQYADDAGQWAASPSGVGRPIQLKDGSMGTRYRTPGGGPGGILDSDGNIITFWYD